MVRNVGGPQRHKAAPPTAGEDWRLRSHNWSQEELGADFPPEPLDKGTAGPRLTSASRVSGRSPEPRHAQPPTSRAVPTMEGILGCSSHPQPLAVRPMVLARALQKTHLSRPPHYCTLRAALGGHTRGRGSLRAAGLVSWEQEKAEGLAKR